MRPEALDLCHPARPVVFKALAEAIRPQKRISVPEWAEARRVISSESGARHTGRWRHDRAPHLIGIMEALGPEDPAEDVVFIKSAQVGGSEVGINFFGYVVEQDPGPVMIVLPSHDEATKYVRTKLQPTIDETPSLRRRVLELTTKTERGSTASYKRFHGGFAQITFAGSSKGLQMLSARYTIGDEVSEWPAEAGERGDPVAQLKARTEIYERDRKRLWVSTPGHLGSCRITADYERSDKQRRYVPCPHCGAYQLLRFDRLKWESDGWPHRAWFECAANGCVIDHMDKHGMMQAGVWIPTAGDDGPGDVIAAEDLPRWQARVVPTRVRGFHIWRGYTLFSSWDSIVAEYLDAKRAGHDRLKVFSQQVLGEAWEDKGDAPDAEKLHKSRVTELARGVLPHGPVVLTGATDVQGNRLEWAVWGWSEGMTRWLVDWGVIEGDPYDAGTWVRHTAMMEARRYRLGAGGEIGVDAWAIDSGYASHAVYNYCRGRPGVFAVDGRDGRTEPFIGTPRKVDVKWNGKRVPKGAVLWPVGTFALKSDLYASIRKAIHHAEARSASPEEVTPWAPGSMILPGDVDLAYAEQLTSEHLAEIETKSGQIVRRWEKLTGRPNEALDIAGYARAMAHHLRLDRLTPDQWAQLRLERFGNAPPDDPQGDLFEVAVAAPVVEAPKDTKSPEGQKPGRRVRGRAR
ncbi:phage terminase large subunit family protein [Pararhodobacter aggregans]|uniref:phage terminase large subunit family protein n=1 Tax=Pararhodobacter aggregans TaxID=404875 RepID=UPI003A949405